MITVNETSSNKTTDAFMFSLPDTSAVFIFEGWPNDIPLATIILANLIPFQRCQWFISVTSMSSKSTRLTKQENNKVLQT